MIIISIESNGEMEKATNESFTNDSSRVLVVLVISADGEHILHKNETGHYFFSRRIQLGPQ